MIEISWLWLPLIVTLILILLAEAFESKQDYGLFKIFSVVSLTISILIYLLSGIYWIVTHIKFV